MNNFSLARPELPDELLSDDGNLYKIDPSHRTVIACLNYITDPDREEIDKTLYIAQRLFLSNPPEDMLKLFTDFVVGEKNESDEEEPLLDFDMDAGVIYASFRQQYGIDLTTEILHWWAFRMLLSGLGDDTPYGKRVQLRTLDLDSIPEKERPKYRKLKDMVSIAPKMSRTEAELQAELDRCLATGKDPTEVLEKLRR